MVVVISRVTFTFRSIAVMLSVAAMPARGYAAALASPSPTPAFDQYLISWKMTASGHSKGPSDKSAEFIFEATQSSASEGQAVVKFDAKGYRLEGRILKGYLTDERDTKTLVLSHKIYCGPISVWDHDHYSLKTLEPMSGPDGKKFGDPYLWMGEAPRKQADGSWVINDIFGPRSWSDYVNRDRRFATLHLNQEWRDRYHYEGENRWLAEKGSGRIHIVCDDSRLPSDLKIESARFFDSQGQGNRHEPMNGFEFPEKLSVPSMGPSPDLFSKEWKYRVTEHTCSGPGSCGDLPVDVDWTITVRRLGKCHVSGQIPIDDNADIKDEEIEMGVEHGSDTIDPDNGVAALNIRLTCDTVPIKNAEVEVKVDVQKNTGGHTHDPADRPRGRLTWNGQETRLTDAKPSIKVKTDDDGRAHLTFKPGKAITCGGTPLRYDSAGKCDRFGIAGIYRFTATSVRIPDHKAQVAVEAKVDGLSHLDDDPNYVNDVGTARHTSGDNATAATKKALVQFANAFRDVQEEHNKTLVACGAPPGPAPEAFSKPAQLQQWPIFPLWVIDVSLPFGGQYDIGPPDGALWSTPHQDHPRGDGVDLSVHNRILSGKAASQNHDKRPWPADNFNVPVCDGYKIAPEGWLMIKMSEVGLKYGHWDAYDWNLDSQPWHLHVNQ